MGKTQVLNDETVVSLSRIYVDIQVKIKELEAERQNIKETLFRHFDLTVGKETPAEIECGDGFKFAREVRVSKRLDEIKLEEMLEPVIWRKVTTVNRSVNETKLKKAIANNVINKNVIKKCIVEKRTFAFTHPSVKRAEK
jgi:hypothetical protein